MRCLRAWFPATPSRVVDLGCGTGTLSELAAALGHTVTGIDLSPRMLARARRQVPDATFVESDVADPPLPEASVDVVLCRHVLWALPDLDAALPAALDQHEPATRSGQPAPSPQKVPCRMLSRESICTTRG